MTLVAQGLTSLTLPESEGFALQHSTFEGAGL